MSKTFKVMRGVRQGDPLSCALFNLAIELLACRIRNNINLKGLNIPAIERKQIINLYADDTCLFLSKEDNLDHVKEILDEWCKALGVKFNTEKTEIVPIGSWNHRARMIETRKLNQDERAPLDEKIKISRDKEAIRLLGAWIGNDTEAERPWEPVIDKIHKTLTRYRWSHPTMTERKIIIQMVVGGYMQFLTQAQGMPTKIEEVLTKIIRNFMWEDNKSPRVTLEYLHYPHKEGGLNLLDIKARNEAIEIMWLKEYLNLSPLRLTWAKITDITIDVAAP